MWEQENSFEHKSAEGETFPLNKSRSSKLTNVIKEKKKSD